MGVKIRERVKGSGTWWLFINYKNKRTARLIGKKKAAEKAMEYAQARLKLGQWMPEEKPAVVTLKEYWDKTFKPVYVESALAESTAASYIKNFDTHILPALGSRRLDEVNHDRMEEFVSDLVKKAPHARKKTAADDDQQQPKAEESQRTLAKATIQTIVKQLCKMFNHARKRKLIADNPASGLSQLYSQAPSKHDVIEPLTREEVPLFLTIAKQSDNVFVTVKRPDGTKYKRKVTQHYPMFVMAIHTGLRAGELAGLQWGDIDFHGKYVVVQRSIDRVHRKIVPTKSKRIRRVDLSDELIAILKEHLRQQKEFWLAEGKPQPEWLFPNVEGGWPDMRNLCDRHFDRCLGKAGLHRRRFHDLRHTFASLLLTNGAPIAYVSEQMGHASIQLTVKLYGHLQPGANRHWMNSLPSTTAVVISNPGIQAAAAPA